MSTTSVRRDGHEECSFTTRGVVVLFAEDGSGCFAFFLGSKKQPRNRTRRWLPDSQDWSRRTILLKGPLESVEHHGQWRSWMRPNRCGGGIFVVARTTTHRSLWWVTVGGRRQHVWVDTAPSSGEWVWVVVLLGCTTASSNDVVAAVCRALRNHCCWA